MQRTAPTRRKNLVGEHFPELGLIGSIGDDALTQLTLAGTRLGRQDVTGKSVLPGDFARTGFLEALGSTLVCLQLRHVFL